MERRRIRCLLPQSARAVVRIPEWALAQAGPASESSAPRRWDGERPAWSPLPAGQARRERCAQRAEQPKWARWQREKSWQYPAAGVAGAAPKESVLGGEPEARSATGSPDRDWQAHSHHLAARSLMADAMETQDAPAPELQHSQAAPKPQASRVLGQLGVAHFSQQERALPPPLSAVQVPVSVLLRDSLLALRRPFPPRAGGDSARHRRRASWSASSCL